MTPRTQKSSRNCRWILITSELVLATDLLAAVTAGRDVRHETSAFLLVGICASVAWAFLCFGSPFLVSTQRWLAILGWCIAVGAVLLPVL
jgi:hypothetical protein